MGRGILDMCTIWMNTYWIMLLKENHACHNIDSTAVKEYFKVEITRLENVHTFLGIEDTFDSCENFRLQNGAKYQFQEKKVNNITDYRKVINSNYEFMLKPCNLSNLANVVPQTLSFFTLFLKETRPLQIYLNCLITQNTFLNKCLAIKNRFQIFLIRINGAVTIVRKRRKDNRESNLSNPF